MGTVKEIFILHGWAMSTERWKPILEILSKKGIKINLLNIPGLTEKIDKPWTLGSYVNWLKEIVGSKKVILLGHSNGGRIALAFAVKYPQNLEKIILIDSAGIYHNELPIRIKRIVFKSIAKIGKKIVSSNQVRNLLYKLTGENDYKNADPVQKQTMLNLISHDLTSSLDKIKIPTLIIWGGKDKITPLSDGKLMNELIKNSRLEIISRAKHSPQFSNPDTVARKIYEYL